jgi:hypothetical protein
MSWTTEESGLDPWQRQENFVFFSVQIAHVLSGRDIDEIYFKFLGYIVVQTYFNNPAVFLSELSLLLSPSDRL